MLRSKTSKTILIIFAVITVIGIASSLFGGSRTGGSSSGNNSGTNDNACVHDFEIISSETGTCEAPGSETVKCTICEHTETRELIVPHTYNYTQICKVCGGSNRVKLIDTYALPSDQSECVIGEISETDPFAMIIVLNEGGTYENTLLTIFDGSNVSYENWGLSFDSGIVTFGSGGSFSECGFDTITIYKADPTLKYCSFNLHPDYFNVKDNSILYADLCCSEYAYTYIGEITVSGYSHDYYGYGLSVRTPGSSEYTLIGVFSSDNRSFTFTPESNIVYIYLISPSELSE